MSRATTPADVAKQFCKAIQQDDFTAAAKYVMNPRVLDFGVQNEAQQVEMKTTIQRDKFKIMSYKTSGKAATVTVQVTAPNLSELSSEFFKEDLLEVSGHQLSATPLAKIKRDIEAAPLYTVNVPLKMEKYNGKWKVTNQNYEFEGAVNGSAGPLANVEKTQSNNG